MSKLWHIDNNILILKEKISEGIINSCVCAGRNYFIVAHPAGLLGAAQDKRKRGAVIATTPLTKSHITELQLGHWVLAVRFRHFGDEVFYVGEIVSDKLRAFSVAHSLPLRLELLIAPDLGRIG